MAPNIPDLRAAVAAATTDAERTAAMLELASQLVHRDAGESLAVAAESLEIARRLKDEQQVAQGLLILGKANQMQGNYKEALEQLRQAQTMFERFSNAKGVMQATGNIGSIHYNCGEYPAAEEHLRIALAIAREQGDQQNIAFWMMVLGKLHQSIDPVSALETLRVAYGLAMEIGHKACASEVASAIGDVLSLRGDYADAREHHCNALALAEACDLLYFVAKSRGKIGDVSLELGDYASALHHYELMLQSMEELNNRDGIAMATGSIGNAHYLLDRNLDALEYYRKAVAIWEDLGHHETAALWRVNLGHVLEELAEYEQALEQYRSALAWMEEHGRRQNIGVCQGEIGDICFHRGEYIQALEQYRSALAIAEEFDDRRFVANWTARIGRVYAMTSFAGYDPVHAEELLSRAIDLITEASQRHALLDTHQWLSTLYQQEGKWEAAHQQTVRYFEVKEEIQNLEAHRRAQQLEHRRQIAELEKQRAVEQAEAEIQRMKAEQTEKELGNATLQLLAQSQLLSDLRSDLLMIARKIPSSEPGARELRERVKNLPCQSVDWEKFDRQFKAVHPDFIRRLTERAPDLTATELRICTMLRMNLKSIEMAQIFCISESGVEFHRKHIRRKLKLAREERLPIVLGAM